MELSFSYSFGEVEKPTRQKIMGLQEALQELPENIGPEEARDRFNTHYFAPGVYGRHIFMPRDTVVVGKIHKHAHLNVLIRGKVKVVTEFGEDFMEGPKIWTSEPGTKRAVYVMEDTEWMTIHPNPDDLRDIDELEDLYVVESFEDYDRLRIERGEIV